MPIRSVTILGLCLCAALCFSQQTSTPKTDVQSKATANPYIPSAEQSKDLRIAQLEAINAQQAYAAKAQQLPEYQQFQQALQKLTAECEKVKKDNKWPSEVQCDMGLNPITFSQKEERLKKP